MSAIPIRRALIAVYDKTGIADFAKALVEDFGIEIISTGGTAKHLEEAGIPVTMVEAVTGFPEMLDGRVKTLHPKIHAGILADRDNPEHMRQLKEHGIKPIDMVVVNLYPFEETVKDPDCKFEDAVEMIDIGGPCMLRAAAKNHKHVLVVFHPDMYEETRKIVRSGLTRQQLMSNAACAFLQTCRYDEQVTGYFTNDDGRELWHNIHLWNYGPLRYGENAHQSASRLAAIKPDDELVLTRPHVLRYADPESAVALSFNNYVDADAALGLCAELARSAQQLSLGSALWHRLIAGANTRDDGQPANQLVTGEKSSRRNLPHIQKEGATYFLTFRIKAGSLSIAERDFVMECCLFPDRKLAIIHAVTVMPDHVHVLLTPLTTEGAGSVSLSKIMHGVKGVSGRKIADHRGQAGPVWQDETFDRIVRNKAEFREKLNYICENPITADIPNAKQYPWTICERNPGWSDMNRAAIVDHEHELVSYFPGAENHERNFHRLLAGATAQAASKSDASVQAAKSTGASARNEANTSAEARNELAACVFIKHTNACGVGISNDPKEAYRQAYLGDPNAAMGGILAVNFTVDKAFAETVMATLQLFKDDAIAGGCANPPQAFFAEVIVAPGYDDDAIEVIRSAKKWGERVRLLDVGEMTRPPSADDVDYKRIAGGMLMQSPDLLGLNEDDWKIATDKQPTDAELNDARLAWLTCKHTKSNAITVCKDGMLIGNGAGQMSRVMSCRIATWLAKENGHAAKLAGSVAASDAFFPFRDGLDILADAGVTTVIQPGGSKRDDEVIAAANERGIAMILTGTRHFKH